jgi:hypothetical protein
LPFHGIDVLERAAYDPSDSEPPWVEADGQGLPSVPSLIRPHRALTSFENELALDPLAFLLRGDVYVKIRLPYPAPIEPFVSQMRSAIDRMSVGECREALARAKLLSAYSELFEAELRRRLTELG